MNKHSVRTVSQGSVFEPIFPGRTPQIVCGVCLNAPVGGGSGGAPRRSTSWPRQSSGDRARDAAAAASPGRSEAPGGPGPFTGHGGIGPSRCPVNEPRPELALGVGLRGWAVDNSAATVDKRVDVWTTLRTNRRLMGMNRPALGIGRGQPGDHWGEHLSVRTPYPTRMWVCGKPFPTSSDRNSGAASGVRGVLPLSTAPTSTTLFLSIH